MTLLASHLLEQCKTLPQHKVLPYLVSIEPHRNALWKEVDSALLGLACMANDDHVAKKVLERRPEFLNAPFVPGQMASGHCPVPVMYERRIPPLNAAVMAGSDRVVSLLLGKPGIDVHQEKWIQSPSRHCYPLRQATSIAGSARTEEEARPYLSIARQLVAAGADPFLRAGAQSIFSEALQGLNMVVRQGNTALQESRWEMLSILCRVDGKDMEEAAWPAIPGIVAVLRFLCIQTPAMQGAPALTWIREKTGIDLPTYGDTLLAWLLDKGLTHQDMVDFVREKFPLAETFLTQKTLSALSLSGSVESTGSSCRMRL